MQLTDGVPPPPLDLPPSAVSQLLIALQSVRQGDFTVRLPGDWTGVQGKLADTFNDIVRSNRRMFCCPTTRVGVRISH